MNFPRTVWSEPTWLALFFVFLVFVRFLVPTSDLFLVAGEAALRGLFFCSLLLDLEQVDLCSDKVAPGSFLGWNWVNQTWESVKGVTMFGAMTTDKACFERRSWLLDRSVVFPSFPESSIRLLFLGCWVWLCVWGSIFNRTSTMDDDQDKDIVVLEVEPRVKTGVNL